MKIFIRVLSAAAAVCLGLGIFTAAAARPGTENEKVYGNLKYVSYEDHITITGSNWTLTDKVEEVKIPEEIDGLPITEIGEYAFSNLSVKEIIIPDSVNIIAKGAFFRCTELTGIILPENLSVIKDGAFEYCWNLSEVKLPEKLLSIGGHAFGSCESLKEIYIPSSVEIIGEWAFSECSELNKVVICNPICDLSSVFSTFVNGYDESGNSYFNGTIYGHEGSTAQRYAKRFDVKFEALANWQKGDIDQNGAVNCEDVIVLKMSLTGMFELTNSQGECADMNDDGIVNVFDLILLKRSVM